MAVTITIRNKRTGEVKVVTPDEALNLGMPIEKVVAKVEAAEKLQQFSEGKSLIATEGEKEAGRKEESAATLLDDLFALYYGKEGETPLSLTEAGKYRLPAQLKALETKFKAGKANSVEERIYKYNRILESKRSKLAKAAGDAGNLALQEQILAGRGLPDPASTFGESVTLFQSAYDNFAGGNRPKKLDQLIEQTQPQPNVQQPTTVSPSAIPSVQPPPTGRRGQAITTAGITAASLLPFKFGAPVVGGSAEALRQVLFPSSEERGVQGLKQVGEAAKAATIGRATTFGLGKVLHPLKTVQGVGKFFQGKVAGVKIDPKSLVEAGKQYVKDVPLAKSTLDKILPSVKQATDVPSLLQKLDRWGKLTYTKAGDPKSTAAANLMNTLYAAGRQELAKKAPFVAGARTTAGKIRNVQKSAKGVGRLATGAAVTGATFFGLNKLFGKE